MRTLASRFDLRAAALDFMLVTAGALLLIANLNLFLIPSQIAPGGSSGAAIIINEFTGWPVGLTMLALNIPLLILGFRHLGHWRFLARTLYGVLLYNLGTDLVAGWFSFGSLTDDLLLNALFAGVVGGIGNGLIYRGGGTPAGSNILGRVLQTKTGLPLSLLYLLTDGTVILVAGLVFGWEKALYALITVYVWGLGADYVLKGSSVARTALIVTDRPEAVAKAVQHEMSLGLTAWPARKTSTETPHTVLFCTVSRARAHELERVVTEADPHASLALMQSHQAQDSMLGSTGRARNQLSQSLDKPGEVDDG